MRRRKFRNPMLRLSSNRRERLFEPTSFNNPKPKSSLKLPSSDLFLTVVIVISYFLTRISYETHPIPKFGNELFALINKTGLGLKPPKNTRLFRMNSHYKRGNKQISDFIFLSLLAFFSFKVNWNNMGSSTNADKLAWVVSVLVAPIIINIFIENKNKHKINPDLVSSVKQLKESNNQTKVFLSFALLLTLAVGAKLVHRTMVCKGGITKPVLIQIIIIGTTVGLYLIANKEMERHKPYSEHNIRYLYEKEKKKYAENFENKWIEKHKRITSNWKNELIRFDNSGDKFIPYSVIYEYGKNERLKKGFQHIQNIMRYNDKNLKKLKDKNFKSTIPPPGGNVNNLKDIWPLIRVEYNLYALKYYKQTGRYDLSELLTKDGNIIEIDNNGNYDKTLLPDNHNLSKMVYQILNTRFRISPSLNYNYDKLINNIDNVRYSYYIRNEFYTWEDDNKMSKIFEYNGEDHSEFLRYNKDKIDTMYISWVYMDKYPGYKNENIIDKTIRYGNYNDRKLETFEDFLKYHKEQVNERRRIYKDIKGDFPTLQDVQNLDSIYPEWFHNGAQHTSLYDNPFRYHEKQRFIKSAIILTIDGLKYSRGLYEKSEDIIYKDYVSHYKSGKPRIDIYGNIVSSSNFEKSLANKSVKQHGWVIAFLLILSFTVCKKDTIDYIIEGSLWGYLIQNIARWDDISPNIM